MSDLYPVKPEFAARARIDRATYEREYRASVEDPDVADEEPALDLLRHGWKPCCRRFEL